MDLKCPQVLICLIFSLSSNKELNVALTINQNVGTLKITHTFFHIKDQVPFSPGLGFFIKLFTSLFTFCMGASTVC